MLINQSQQRYRVMINQSQQRYKVMINKGDHRAMNQSSLFRPIHCHLHQLSEFHLQGLLLFHCGAHGHHPGPLLDRLPVRSYPGLARSSVDAARPGADSSQICYTFVGDVNQGELSLKAKGSDPLQFHVVTSKLQQQCDVRPAAVHPPRNEYNI